MKWHKGKPRHIGWWLTYSGAPEGWWRWWNGQLWSYGVRENAPVHYANHNANIFCDICVNTYMQWCDYWPESARVPRMKP